MQGFHELHNNFSLHTLPCPVDRKGGGEVESLERVHGESMERVWIMTDVGVVEVGGETFSVL